MKTVSGDSKLREVEAKFDNVEKPRHYNYGKFEVIEVIKDWLTEEEFRGYLRGNILKYEARYRIKNGVEDLKKAQWYNDRLIELESGKWRS